MRQLAKTAQPQQGGNWKTSRRSVDTKSMDLVF
jgi:hypothetical protein